MERLDGRYIAGYTKALLDVQHFFEQYSESLKHNRLYSQKGIDAVLKLLLENREELRETGNIGDVVCRKEGGKIIISKKGE